MKKEELREKIIEIMQGEHCTEAYERLAEAFFDSVNTDDEPYRKIGYYLMKAFLEDNVDDALMALCGWSLQSLLAKAKLIPDEEGVFVGEEESEENNGDVAFDKGALIHLIAHNIVDEGTANTSTGNWIVYFDEIQEKYNMNLNEDKEMLAAIADEIRNSNAEKIAEISITDDAFDIVYYLDFCPNAE